MDDVFGKALHDYWAGDAETPIVIRSDDDQTDTHSPSIWFDEALYPSEILVEDLIRGRILDVGCGAGRHLMRYQPAGYDITGIDASAEAIEVCRQRGCNSVIEGDVFTHPLEQGAFDTILLFGNNLGMGGTRAGAVALLSRLLEAVRDDGQLLIAAIDVTATNGGRFGLQRSDGLPDRESVGQISMRVEYGDQIGDWFDWLHVLPEDLPAIAEEAGWQVARILPAAASHYAAVLRPAPLRYGRAPYSYRSDPDIPDFPDDRPLIVFDGVCILCSGFVRFVIDHDPQRQFRFTTAQSPLGQALFHHYGLDTVDFETNLVIMDGVVWGELRGFAKVMSRLRRPWRWLRVLRFIPEPLSGWLYRRIALNRYALFGKTDICMVPPADWQDRFLS